VSSATDRIPTRITALLQIRYPIIQGGMIWCSGWKLASAVSNAGGLGLIGAGSMTPELLKEHIGKTQSATSAPFGVNIPVSNDHADGHVQTCIRGGVKIVFTSAGSPKKYTEKLKAAGVTVLHVVPSAKLAQKVELAGCDAVVAEGTEAGGHNGFEEITSLCLWPHVALAVSIPVTPRVAVWPPRWPWVSMVCRWGLDSPFPMNLRRTLLTRKRPFAPEKEKSVYI